MKSFLLLFIFVMTMPFAQAQETFPISPIGPQRVFPGAKITTTLSAVNHDLPSISLSAINLPSFGNFLDKGKGFGTFTFEPDATDVGNYLVTLQAVSGSDTSKTTFQITVPNLPTGNKYYVDPINGDNNNPGSASQPWHTLTEVFNTGKNIQANDIIYLRSGNHGAPVVNKIQSGPTYILAEKGHTPMFEKLNFFLAKNWVLSGIKISPEADSTSFKGNYLRIQPTCSFITIENCEIYGTSDVMNWTTNQLWYDNAGDGVLINSTDGLFRNNYIYNVYFGLTVDGVRNTVSHNLLNNYGGDGFRGLANDCKYLYNRIQNALVDDYATGNHDDGFQSWTFGGPIKNVVLKGNQIFSHSDPSLPLKTSVLQGMVNFDGFSENWVIEDNLLLTDHPHGITLLGATNCKVTNNTVINNPLMLFSYGNPPWIRIGPHKSGAKSLGNLNRNNLMAFNYDDGDSGTFDHNLIANYDAYFVNFNHWNFHLKPDSAPINAGTFLDGSTKDNSQRIRFDSFPDIGAYEFGDQPYDFQPPTATPPVYVVESTPSAVTVAWTPATDNYIVKKYILKIGGQYQIETDSTIAELLDLRPNTSYDCTIQTEDYAGNLSEKTNFNFITPKYTLDSLHITLPVAHEDQIIKSNGTLPWIGLQYHTLGGFTYFYDGSISLPFKLTSIPSEYKIARANLTINLNRIINSPNGNTDLYAMGIRNSPKASIADNWQGIFGESPSGQAIEDDFLTKDMELGFITTADSSGVKLADIINQPNTTNQYLILRLNSDVENESNYRFYEFQSADHSNTKLRPKLELLLTKLVANIDPIDTPLKVYPNPVMDHSSISVDWPEDQFNGKLTLTIFNTAGQVIHRQNLEKQIHHIDIPSNLLPKKGAYYLVISDLTNYFSSKLIRD